VAAADVESAVMRLRNIVLYGYHGVSAAEQEVGTRIEVDVAMLIQPADPDVLSSTVDYYSVYMAVEEVVTQTRYKLLETLARALRRRLLETFPARQVEVRVRKPNVPFPGGTSHVEVQVGSCNR
jgi:dihydroneopterin aldolase